MSMSMIYNTFTVISQLISINLTSAGCKVNHTSSVHCSVRSTELAMNGIHYRGFHVDDLPTENIYQYIPDIHFESFNIQQTFPIFRHLQSSANYIHEVVSHGGVILVNCYMGLSRCRCNCLALLLYYYTCCAGPHPVSSPI